MTKRKGTNWIIVHHSATSRDTTTFEAIKKWHIENNKWDNIGYHWVIEGDGSVHEGMPEEMVGYHCRADGMNLKSIGICLTGNFMTDSLSSKQLLSLRGKLDELRSRYALPRERVIGHREVSGAATSCPGSKLAFWLSTYRNVSIGDNHPMKID